MSEIWSWKTFCLLGLSLNLFLRTQPVLRDKKPCLVRIIALNQQEYENSLYFNNCLPVFCLFTSLHSLSIGQNSWKLFFFPLKRNKYFQDSFITQKHILTAKKCYKRQKFTHTDISHPCCEKKKNLHSDVNVNFAAVEC